MKVTFFIISSIKPSGDNEHEEPKALNMSKIDEHELHLKPVAISCDDLFITSEWNAYVIS